MYVCMYICMYLSIYVCMCIYLHARAHGLSVHTCYRMKSLWIAIDAYTYIHAYTCIYI